MIGCECECDRGMKTADCRVRSAGRQEGGGGGVGLQCVVAVSLPPFLLHLSSKQLPLSV